MFIKNYTILNQPILLKKSIKYILFCFLFLACDFTNAQEQKKTEGNRTIDSLLNVLKVLSSPSPEIRLVKGADTVQINTLNLLSRQYRNMDSIEQAFQYSQQAKDLAEKSGFLKGEAIACANIGIIYERKGDYENALINHFKALKIRKEIGAKRGIAGSYNSIGVTYVKQGNYQKAMENYLNCLKIIEELGDKKAAGTIYSNVGNIYFNQNNYEKALENYLTSLKIETEIGDKEGEALTYGNIGAAYQKQGKYNEALNSHLKCLQICEEIEDKQGIAVCYNNIGNLFEEQGDYKKALNNQLKSLEISEAISDIQLIAVIYGNIGNIYLKQENFEKALHYNHLALNILKKIGFKAGIKDAYSSLANLYEKKGDYKQAYSYRKLYSDIKDTLLNEQSSKQITEMNTKYDSEKKDKELIKKDAEINKQQAETEKQNLQRNAFIIGFVLVLVLAFFIFRGYRQKQSANKLLEGKNILIENQKQLVVEKNNKITESINYAKRIQQAILPSNELIKSFLPESFIFFRPKDIVSGDFYWFAERGNKLIIAVADCTGHGVPGAFMSMIGNTLLNEIVNVKNISKPDEILNQLNIGIVSLLHQNETASSTQDDGMDITILAIDKENREIEFAGANHFSYLFNDSKCETLKGDVFSIGGMFGSMNVNFTSQKIKLVKDSTLYLFTDGFADQFGGIKNTKLLSSGFAKLLEGIQRVEMDQQLEKLTCGFENWKGNNKQLDDLLVVGIRL
ncbi:MAG: tetratricopeptide repeat protein [Bacteroidota bacterium]